VATYTDPGFGVFLRTDPAVLAVYREKIGKWLADVPRLVTIWRALGDAADRDSFSPAQVEEWLRHHRGDIEEDLADLRIYANIWMARP
jgi:hypothetical protein